MRILSCTALLLSVTALAADDSWPQFRGPGGTGISKATGLPTAWDESTNVVWKTAIHDKGWSSPVVFGKQVWVTTAREDGKEQWAVCVDRDTGKVVHDIKVFDTPKLPYFAINTYNSHASCTPAIEKGRLYVHFGSAGTACLDPDSGKVLWSRRDLECDHFRGPGSSPIIWEDLLVLTFDGHDRQYLTALDKKTGKTVWRTPRGFDYGTTNGDLKKGYSTPAVLDVGGKLQLVSSGAGWSASYDPRTGKEFWRVRHGGMNAATPPQVVDGLVLVTTSSPAKMLAVKPDGSGDVTKTHVAWTLQKEAPSRSSPLVLGDLVFVVSEKGVATCLDGKSGEAVWTRRVPGNYSSSPVYAGGHLYVFSHEGKGYVLTADREGKIVATNALEAGVRGTPAPVGKALYVRTLTHLYRIEKK